MLIHYKCGCMKQEAGIDVPDRRLGSCVVEWMNMIQVCIATDHHALSSHCKKLIMEYAKIPVQEGIGIGTAPTDEG